MQAPIKAQLVAGVGGAVVVLLAAAPVLLPAAVHAAGFGASGIVAGSWAASLMRSYGGAVPSGSICALLQRVGTRGLSTSMEAVMEATAAAIAAALGISLRYSAKKGSHVRQLSADVTPMLSGPQYHALMDVENVPDLSADVALMSTGPEYHIASVDVDDVEHVQQPSADVTRMSNNREYYVLVDEDDVEDAACMEPLLRQPVHEKFAGFEGLEGAASAETFCQVAEHASEINEDGKAPSHADQTIPPHASLSSCQFESLL